ncbi:sporulation histidine kinase inhibitor Sda [Fredinandcohnia sp. 179-A 10B2 NHS]
MFSDVNDTKLKEIYIKATEQKVDKEFISLLEKEINKRGLNIER